MPYNPVLSEPFVTPPRLMMVAPGEERAQANYGRAQLAYQLPPDPEERYDSAGGYFGLLYHPSALFDEATSIQTEFVKRWLWR